MPSPPADQADASQTPDGALSAPAIDNSSKAHLHEQLRRLGLPPPRYETTVHTSYSVNIVLPSELRALLAQTSTLSSSSSNSAQSLLQAWDHRSVNGSRGVWKGRPAKEKRDALRRTVDIVTGKLAAWMADRVVEDVKRREWKVGKRERKKRGRERKKDMASNAKAGEGQNEGPDGEA